MDLAGKYEKSNLLGDGEVKVWRGRERSRGTPVLLHTFTGSPKLLLLATEYLLNRPAFTVARHRRIGRGHVPGDDVRTRHAGRQSVARKCSLASGPPAAAPDTSAGSDSASPVLIAAATPQASRLGESTERSSADHG